MPWRECGHAARHANAAPVRTAGGRQTGCMPSGGVSRNQAALPQPGAPVKERHFSQRGFHFPETAVLRDPVPESGLKPGKSKPRAIAAIVRVASNGRPLTAAHPGDPCWDAAQLRSTGNLEADLPARPPQTGEENPAYSRNLRLQTSRAECGAAAGRCDRPVCSLIRPVFRENAADARRSPRDFAGRRFAVKSVNISKTKSPVAARRRGSPEGDRRGTGNWPRQQGPVAGQSQDEYGSRAASRR